MAYYEVEFFHLVLFLCQTTVVFDCKMIVFECSTSLLIKLYVVFKVPQLAYSSLFL